MKKDETCHYCGSAMEVAKTNFTVAKEEVVYVVRDVPCLQCTLCEEVIFEDKTAEQLSRYVSGRILPTRRQLTAYVYHWDDPVTEIPVNAPPSEIKNIASVRSGETTALAYTTAP